MEEALDKGREKMIRILLLTFIILFSATAEDLSKLAEELKSENYKTREKAAESLSDIKVDKKISKEISKTLNQIILKDNKLQNRIYLKNLLI